MRGLVSQANRATEFIQERGPALISELSQQFAGEMVGLIDEYVDRVNTKIRYEVGYTYTIQSFFRTIQRSITNIGNICGWEGISMLFLNMYAIFPLKISLCPCLFC